MTLHKVHKLLPFTLGYLQRSSVPSITFLEFLRTYAKQKGLFFVKMEPNEESQKSKVKSLKSKTLGIVESTHPLFPNWTMKLDLTSSIEELKANLHPKNRYNIGLSSRKGVIVKNVTNDTQGFKDFKQLFFATTKRQNYNMHNEHYHNIVFKHMKDASIAHIFTAYLDNKPLASYEIFLHKNVLYYPYGGSSDTNRNVMAANLLMWSVIEWGKQHGATMFDMWGAMDPKQYEQYPNDPWAGFTRFKLQFNATFTQMIGSYDMVLNPILYWLYTILYKIVRR